MRAEDDAGRDLGREVRHLVAARVEFQQRLFRRQEVLLGRHDGRGIVELDLVERFDDLKGVAPAALDRSHHLVGFHERRHERGKFACIDDSIEHACVLCFSSTGWRGSPRPHAAYRLAGWRSKSARGVLVPKIAPVRGWRTSQCLFAPQLCDRAVASCAACLSRTTRAQAHTGQDSVPDRFAASAFPMAVRPSERISRSPARRIRGNPNHG